MKTTILLSIILSFFFISCGDDKPCCTMFDAAQGFYVVNDKGEDLLDPDNKNGIDVSKLTIYYVINNEKIEAVEYYKQTTPNASLDNPYGYSIPKEPYEGKYSLIVDLNHKKTEDGAIAYTLIEWDKNDIDTITAKNTVKGDHYFVSNMIKFNDVDWSPQNGEYIYTIVK